ncbi:MAG TPA: dipeptidase [Thermoanaerobaculia bacterium]|nr:dipeptidase [Thermoanaerobaculia bacterium]HUM30442.1 dipeptidase [Thermoanaerobaculia bacterium]HXK68691.1 dipeptidase [Thermoanaerobaculia bacterium]
MRDILSYAETNRSRFLSELSEFVAIPSISTDEEHRPDMMHAAKWLQNHLSAMGLAARIMDTGGHPAVVGEWSDAPGKPTLLLYGHYDVQPADPLDLWTSPPFTLTERDGALYARGISDDKGQLFIHLKAMECFLSTKRALPVNVTVLLEGEEEIGSPSLPEFLKKHASTFRSDIAVISDNPMLGRGMPAVGYGLRGLAYLEVILRGPAGDLHSGRFGGAVANPANVLCSLLTSLKDPGGKITIPGFYDRVRPMTDEERQAAKHLPLTETDLARAAGVTQLVPEEGYSAIESIWSRPSLDIHGLTSGFQGKGAKTIIPSEARAKISSRLVPDQTPEEILEKIETCLRQRCPSGVSMEIIRHEGAYPAMVDRDAPALQMARDAVSKGFGKPCHLIRQGGTIPVVSLLKQILELNTLLLGFGLPEENAHAPNEFLLLENFEGGLNSILHLYDLLGSSSEIL